MNSKRRIHLRPPVFGSNPRGAKSWPACRMNWAKSSKNRFLSFAQMIGYCPLTGRRHRSGFRDAVEWSAEPEHEKVIILVWADGTDHKIEINPRRSFGEPVVRGINTSALADAWRASLAVLPSPQFDKNTAHIPVGDSTKR
jgi:hypothetical protein